MMFTPQKVWSGFRLTPKSGASKTGNASGLNLNSGASNLNYGDGAKGKSVTFGEAVTPLSDSMLENGGNLVVGSGETALDRDVLLEKIASIEKELFEYQYNMGLLLIEKKEWTCKYEEYSLALGEAKDALKREQAAHLIAISDVEKREEALMKALGVEKECVLDLDKALREIRNENAEIKFTSDSKLAEANALAASIEEKSLEVEAKLRASEAKLAEVNRRSAEVDRKLQDLEAGESAILRDRLSLNAERESQDSIFSNQREDLREWERKLRDGEDRLAKAQTNINQREERANEIDRIFKLKEKDLEEVQKKVDAANIELNMKEKDISSRLENVMIKEKEYEAMKTNLEVKEKELLAFEEKLNAREEAEIQKLLDEHNAVLDSKKREFELEFDRKRKSFEEELKNRRIEVENKEVEIKHSEEKIGKREQALEKQLEKFREKEENYDLKLKAFLERESFMKTEEKKLEAEKKQLLTDIEKLESLKAEIEKIRADNEEQILKLREERDHLKITESERLEYICLQTELKQEIDDYRTRKEMLLRESEDLKQQKETFEREWEELDEKRAQIQKELSDLMRQKEEVEKLRQDEEERLKNEKLMAQEYIEREQESLKLAKESFEASMELERSEMAEKSLSDRSQMLHDFELKKQELETDMQNLSEEMDKQFREKQKLFNEERERDLENVNYLREVARREMEEMKLERLKIEKERQEAEANKVHLEKQRVEIRKDIDELFKLSGKLKDQREQLMKERDRFISFVEKQKSCENCFEMTSEFVLSDLQPLAETVNLDSVILPKHPDDRMGAQEIQVSPSGNQSGLELQNDEVSPAEVGVRSHGTGGTVSWLRKCTSKILKFSPVKKMETSHQLMTDEVPLTDVRNIRPEQFDKVCTIENEAELSFAVVSDSVDIQRVQSDFSTRELEASDPSADNQSNINNEVPEEPQPSPLRKVQRKSQRKRKLVNRMRSVKAKAVVEEAQAVLGNGESSSRINAESRDESSLADKKSNNVRKRTRSHSSNVASENRGEDSEGRSDYVVGQRRKRQQKVVPDVQNPGKGRYNLRRRNGAATTGDSTKLRKGNEEEVEGIKNAEEEIHYSKVVPATSLGAASDNGGSTHFVRCMTAANSQEKEGGMSKNDNLALSEEVNGTKEGAGESGDGDEFESESREEDAAETEDEVDGDEESYQHPGEVSIGKKLWTFFTT